MNSDYSGLSARLGVSFNDPELLVTALTHRSVGTPHNERLEFLGDALLSYIVAEALYERFPQAREGELTRLRATLVKGETLAEVARDLGLGEYLRLGGGELKSGGWRRNSILADALEALIGAVYLDGGIAPCKRLVTGVLQQRMQALSPAKVTKDSKTRLQEYLQARKQALPCYQVTAVAGEAHEQYFEVECSVTGLARPTLGQGSNRRYAEQAAAQKALELLLNADT